MNTGERKTGTRKTTISLAVAIVLLAVGAFIYFRFYPEIHQYYVDHRSYKVYGGMTDELKDSQLFNDMQSRHSFCFLGDSITYGSVTEDIPWYQPLKPCITGTVSNFSHSGWGVKNLIDEIANIPDADVYVIAIGINDILFPDDDDSAKTGEEFASKCKELGDLLTARNPGSKVYFISPWSFVDCDISFVERGDEFSSALEEICKTTDYRYINPDPVTQAVIAEEGSAKYMYNDFHPNAPKGVGLFSYAVLKDAHDRQLENN